MPSSAKCSLLALSPSKPERERSTCLHDVVVIEARFRRILKALRVRLKNFKASHTARRPRSPSAAGRQESPQPAGA